LTHGPSRHVAGLHADTLLPGDEIDPGEPAGAREGGVQVAAVDYHVGEAVPAFEVLEVEAGQLRGVDRVLHDHVLRPDAERGHLLEQAVLGEDAGAVGRDLQAGADLANSGACSQDADGQTGAAEGEGGAEAADAAADDDDVRAGGRVHRCSFVTRLVCRPRPVISVITVSRR
jgi:hypothetical protein